MVILVKKKKTLLIIRFTLSIVRWFQAIFFSRIVFFRTTSLKKQIVRTTERQRDSFVSKHVPWGLNEVFEPHRQRITTSKAKYKEGMLLHIYCRNCTRISRFTDAVMFVCFYCALLSLIRESIVCFLTYYEAMCVIPRILLLSSLVEKEKYFLRI